MRQILLIVLCLSLLVLVPAAGAQDDTLLLDQNTLAEVSSATPQPTFIFNASSGQTVEIEVLSVSEGFAPQVTIYTASGVLLQAVGNPTLSNRLNTVVTFPEAGAYQVQVNSANAGVGQFVITARSGEPPIPLPEEQIQYHVLAPGDVLSYSIAPRSDLARVLIIGAGDQAALPDQVRMELKNAEGEVLAMFSSLLGAGSLVLPPSNTPLTLVLSNDLIEPTEVDFSILLTSSTPSASAGTPTAPGEQPVILPTLPTNQGCILAPNLDSGVNVRSGPGLEYDPPITVISQFSYYPVVGRTADSGWYVINYGSGEGWVGSSVTRLAGDCSAIPVREAPTLTPTLAGDTATPTESPSPTATGDTATPSDTPTFTPTVTPTYTPTFTPTATP